MLDKLLIIKRKLLSVFAMLAMVLTGCINDDSLCPADKDGDEQITLEFTVVTRDLAGNGTRALEIPPNLQNGTTAENYLDLDNTTFLLFDQKETLIKVFVPYIDPEENTGYAKYSVRAFMSPQEFHTLTDGKTDVTFSIAVVGNFSRLNPQNAAYHIGQKLEEIFDPAIVATFAMPIRNNYGNSWIPSIYPGTNGQESGHIPMAGIQTYNVSVADLAASTVADPLDLSENGKKDINMLRALAKIEIIDHIDAVTVNGVTTQPPMDERISIKNVELVGHTTRGSLFPSFNQWNLNNTIETQYVTMTSVPESAEYIGLIPDEDLTILNPPAGSVVTFFADKQATDLREDGCTVYSCYLTEYNPAELNGSGPMWIRVTAKYPVVDSAFSDYGNDAESSFFRIEVAPYVDGGIQAAIPVLRNNIYRFQINKVTPPDQNNYITFTVCPMSNYTSDIPTFE